MNSHNASHKGRETQGFTLVETLVALSISVLIVLGTTQIFIEGLGHIRGVRAQALLTSDAGYMVQMIRNELFGAQNIIPINLSTVNIDGKIFTLSDDGRLTLDGAPITHKDVTVTNLVFTKVGESLRIQFTLSSGARTNKTFTGQTTLALRN